MSGPAATVLVLAPPGHHSPLSPGARVGPRDFKRVSRVLGSAPPPGPSRVPTSLRPVQPPRSPGALAAWAGRAGSAPRKRGERGGRRGRRGAGRAGRDAEGRAGLCWLQPPLGSRAAGGGTRDPARRLRARRWPRTILGAPPPEQPGRQPPPPLPAASEPRRRAARADPGRGERGPGTGAETRAALGERGAPAEPAVGGKVRPVVAGGCGGWGSVRLGTEGLRLAKVDGPSTQGLCRSSGTSWGEKGVAEYPSQGYSGLERERGTGPPGSPVPSKQPH